jgi:hypothetical protein
MEDKETEARPLTLTKHTWRTLDKIANTYGFLNAQEVIRQSIAKMIKAEETTPTIQ